jgi:hypothetical protein
MPRIGCHHCLRVDWVHSTEGTPTERCMAIILGYREVAALRPHRLRRAPAPVTTRGRSSSSRLCQPTALRCISASVKDKTSRTASLTSRRSRRGGSFLTIAQTRPITSPAQAPSRAIRANACRTSSSSGSCAPSQRIPALAFGVKSARPVRRKPPRFRRPTLPPRILNQRLIGTMLKRYSLVR